MWSLGKAMQTPEVKRVYISSFWDKPFADNGSHVGYSVTAHKRDMFLQELFEKEREDLFRELRELPRNAAVRKVLQPYCVHAAHALVTQINDLVKRTRYVKVHSLIIGYLKSQVSQRPACMSNGE